MGQTHRSRTQGEKKSYSVIPDLKLTKTNSFPVRRSESFDWKCVTFEFSAFVIYKSRI